MSKPPPTCYQCHKVITFSDQFIGKNGRKIPLDPDSLTPHDCPMREKRTINSASSSGDVIRVGESNQPERVDMQEKDDHGNEEETALEHKARIDAIYKKPTEDKFVDHTLKGQSKVMIFSNETKADTQSEYNEFLRVNNGKIKTQGAHDHVTKQDETEPLVYTIYLYYEEVK